MICLERNAYKVLIGKREGERPLQISGLDDDVKTDRKEIVLEILNWIHLAQDRDQWRAFVNTAMNRRGSVKCRDFLE
jgi:hypothetical protein